MAESVQVLNKVGLALPFLVTLADDNKEMPSEEVRLRFVPSFRVSFLCTCCLNGIAGTQVDEVSFGRFVFSNVVCRLSRMETHKLGLDGWPTCRYRHLDLRRAQMNTNLRMRHNIIKLMRRHLEDVHDFIEVIPFHQINFY